MELVNWIVQTLREIPAIAIFLSIGIGFWIGKLKYKTFFRINYFCSYRRCSYGTTNIGVPGPLKQVFFISSTCHRLQCWSAIFRIITRFGPKQVLFAVVMCVSVLSTRFLRPTTKSLLIQRNQS